MLIRKRTDVPTVEWGNGTSDRLVNEADGLGFAVAHTVVAAGTRSRLQYRRHIEACYCLSGSGSVVEADGTVHEIVPGTLYALDLHDPHELRASEDEDLHLVSIFNPPITGTERHRLDPSGYSQY
ncbi:MULTISPECIES: ectoine synthase [unclassified Rathayibacter]|uniref:ectoine synthase n=1 Tax=unclassified Rathayibacter TaxID=2609250 RepID=UPI00188A1FBB|nr:MULTISPECIES: ectoine synthase [unclassified Rathayibacter]MBF4463176.1 ectoine synthase [Rathayibacter sp. VKM Ac-2879]MBF4504587.1 ectoine synthase [Rathayibacter sp. VKM Ac-2878]